MATEELIVLLDAKTAKLDAKLNGTNDRLDKLDGSTKKADKSFLSFGKAGSIAATGIATLATAALAVNAAISAMVLSSANNRKELEILSTQAKTSTEDFQALAFATQKYGINAEQIADISKDISDRVGEFSAAGTGTFQDYADVLKLTKEEARQTAIEFQGISSQEVIGKMVSEMEKANVTGDQMTFVLESMGNDLSRLKPLFADNSKELGTLKDRFNDVNSSLSITAGQAEGLKEVSTSYTLMTSQLGNAATAISATIAPVMDDFFNDVISIVPEATQTIIDFANSFLDAENISSQAGVLKEIAASQSRLVELENRLAEAKERTNNSGSGLVDTSDIQVESAKVLIEQEKTRTEELNAQLTVLEQQQIRLENVNSLKGGEIGGLNGAGAESSGLGTGDEIQAIADRFKTEEELLVEKLEREREIIGEDKELRLELENEFIENMIAIDEKHKEEELKVKEKADKKKVKSDESRHKTEQSLENKNVQALMQITGSLIGSSSSIGQALFLINQGVALGEAFVNTQAASVKALTIDPTGALSAKVQASGNLSMAAIAAATLGGITGGSGGSSSTSSISTTSDTSSTAQEEFSPETTSLDIRDSTSSGTTQARISFADDSGDDIIDAIAKALNKGQSEGRYV
tara:strand:+ start:3078 stop:4991 length:1914 start_codon:yes stop_codon:yes gene_type:complete